MKILSWNVNGIRAILKKGFLDYLKSESPDILCLQEIKISQKNIEKNNLEFESYQVFWNSAIREGYSGTAILIKKEISKNIISNKNGMASSEFDTEGRIQYLDSGGFYLVNAYFPNANHELSRLDYKLKFNKKLLTFLKKLEKKKPVVICGDFNVAHQEIDLARPKQNEGSAGYTKEERAWMDEFLKNGFKDTYRELNSEKVQYSWWSYRTFARQRNIGWRIDYFCVSANIIGKIRKSFIQDSILGSDHCPIGVMMDKI